MPKDFVHTFGYTQQDIPRILRQNRTNIINWYDTKLFRKPVDWTKWAMCFLGLGERGENRVDCDCETTTEAENKWLWENHSGTFSHAAYKVEFESLREDMKKNEVVWRVFAHCTSCGHKVPMEYIFVMGVDPMGNPRNWGYTAPSWVPSENKGPSFDELDMDEPDTNKQRIGPIWAKPGSKPLPPFCPVCKA